MNYKDKAVELVEQFKDHAAGNCDYSIKQHAKQCATKCVDNIYQSLETTTGHIEMSSLSWQECINDFEYWDRVKAAITKM